MCTISVIDVLFLLQDQPPQAFYGIFFLQDQSPQAFYGIFFIQDQPPQAFYGIFDGHAGTDAATYAAKHITVNLVHSCGLEKNPAEACKSAFKVTDDLFIPKAKKEVKILLEALILNQACTAS